MSYQKQSVRGSVLKGTAPGIQVRVGEAERLANGDAVLALEVSFKSDKWVVRRKYSDILLFLYCNIEVAHQFCPKIDKNFAKLEQQELCASAAQIVADICQYFNSFFIPAAVFFDVPFTGRSEEYVYHNMPLSKKINSVRCGYMGTRLYFTVPAPRPNIEEWKRYFVVLSDTITFFENEVTYRNLGSPEHTIPLSCYTFLPVSSSSSSLSSSSSSASAVAAVAGFEYQEFNIVSDVAVVCFRVSSEEYAGWEGVFRVLPEFI